VVAADQRTNRLVQTAMTVGAIADRLLFVAAPIGVGALLVWLVRLSAPSSNPALGLVIGIIALSPIGLALLMLAVTPTYFRPLVTTRIGVVCLGALVVVAAVTFATAQLGTRLTLKQRAGSGITLIVSALVLGTGAQFLLVLLGPPLAILTTPLR
jgi:hypothetical protein